MHETDSRALTGRVALVTGATRGIGLECARLLARRGARLVVTGRSAERGAPVAEAIGARFVVADSADPLSAAQLREVLEAEYGRLDILVNNAGDNGEPQTVARTTPEALDATLAVHLKAPWLLMTTLVPLMPPGGSIVNIASVAGHRVGASSAAYSVAKAALIHLTRLAAAEFGAARVRVNSVSPGFVPTTIHARGPSRDDARGEKLVAFLSRLFGQRQALDRLGTPGDVAEIVAFLASDAAAFVSGSDFVADGGLIWGRAGLM